MGASHRRRHHRERPQRRDDLPLSPPGRRGCGDPALELPLLSHRPQARAFAGRRQHHRHQVERGDAAQRLRLRRARGRGRPARWRLQPDLRPRPDHRRRAERASRHRSGLLHRQRADRHRDHAGGGAEPDPRQPRARRQGAGDRAQGRRPRSRGQGDHPVAHHQHRPGLQLRRAHLRRARGGGGILGAGSWR